MTGIFTEGDLRRLIERLGDIRPCVMKDVMIRNPKTIRAQELAASAVKLLDTFHCNQLLVVDEDNSSSAPCTCTTDGCQGPLIHFSGDPT